MKRIFKGILITLRIFLSIILMIGLLFGSYTYLNKAFDYKEESFMNTNFKNFPKDSIDILILGSSHAEYSFIPEIVYEETGLYSYVLGSACQPLEVSYELMKEFLKNQKPKLLILEVFTATPQKEVCFADSCYIIPLEALSGEEKYNVVDYLPEEKAQEYYNVFYNNHNDWKKIDNFDFLLPENVLKDMKQEVNYELGYHYSEGIYEYPKNWWHPSTYKDDMEVKLDEKDLKSLNNIYDLCKENNIELMLYKTPIDGIDQLNQSYRHEVWSWAKERNIKYVDFVDEASKLGIYMWIHTDSFHSFVSGAAFMTDYLITNFKELNISFNHKQDNKLDKIYHAGTLNYMGLLLYEYDPYKYLNILSKGYSGVIVIKYMANNKRYNDDLCSYLKEMGVGDFDQNNNYYVILDSGKVLFSSQDNINEYVEIIDRTIDISAKGIYLDNQRKDNPSADITIFYLGSGFQEASRNIDTNTGYEYGLNHYDWDR